MIQMKSSNGDVQREIGYGGLVGLLAWHPVHAVLAEVTMAGLERDDVMDLIAGDRNLPGVIVGHVWCMQAVVVPALKAAGRHDCTPVQMFQNWEEAPAISLKEESYRFCRKTAVILGWPLKQKNIVPYTANLDYAKHGWPEYAHFLGNLRVPAPAEDRNRLLLVPHRDRSTVSSLAMAAWLCHTLKGWEVSVLQEQEPPQGGEVEVQKEWERARTESVWTQRPVPPGQGGAAHRGAGDWPQS